MKVEVKQEHIDKGTRCDSFKCAVALAIEEASGGEAKAAVGYGTINITIGDEYGIWKTPPEVYSFMETFDRGSGAQPFAFELPDKPDWQNWKKKGTSWVK